MAKSPWKSLDRNQKVALLGSMADRLKSLRDGDDVQDRYGILQSHRSQAVWTLYEMSSLIRTCPAYAYRVDEEAMRCRALRGSIVTVDKREFWWESELLETFYVVADCENVGYVSKGTVLDEGSLAKLIEADVFVKHGESKTYSLDWTYGRWFREKDPPKQENPEPDPPVPEKEEEPRSRGSLWDRVRGRCHG
jgi:hypothetical protein